MIRFLMTLILLMSLACPAWAAKSDDIDDFTQKLEQDLHAISSDSKPVEKSTTKLSQSVSKPVEQEAAEPAPLLPPAPPVVDEPSPSSAPAAPQASQPSQVPPHPTEVLDIVIVGNQIVSTNTIISKIKTRKGTPLAQEMVNEDLKRLYATGFFEDIKMEIADKPDGYVLQISVVEKPIIKTIVIEGNQAFKEDKLRKELKVLEGQILDRKAVKEGVEAIRKLYMDKGFRFMDVVSNVDVDYVSKQATVLIRIKEDEKYKIRTIDFQGNKAFPNKKLGKLMKTKPKGWVFRSGVFKQDQFEQDVERLRLFYQQEGYLDVKVAPEFEYDKTGQKMGIKVLVDEGAHYVTGDVKIEGNRLFPQSEIWQEPDMLPSTTFSQFYLSKDVEKVRQYYYQRGYMDVRIVPDTHMNKETNKVDVQYQIDEGDLYFVVNEFHRDSANGVTGGRRLQIKATGYFRNVGIEDYLMTPVPPGWPK